MTVFHRTTAELLWLFWVASLRGGIAYPVLCGASPRKPAITGEPA